MPGDIRETNNHSSIGELDPIEVVAPGVIGRVGSNRQYRSPGFEDVPAEEVTAGWSALPAGRAGRPPASAWFLPREELIGHAYGSPPQLRLRPGPPGTALLRTKADARLGHGSWHTGNGRPPTEVQSCTNVGNGSNGTGERALIPKFNLRVDNIIRIKKTSTAGVARGR